MRKIISSIALVAVVVAAILAWLFLGPATSFKEKSTYLYIATGKANGDAILDSIEQRNLLSHPTLFNFVAKQMKVWERVKPGRYQVKKGQSLVSIARMLRNNQQSPVKLVINKLRTKEDLGKLIGRNFETDSSTVLQYLKNSDSLATLNINDDTFMTIIIPDTYTFYWTTPVGKILKRLKFVSTTFWERNDRKQKAEELGFSPTQIYIIASIVEEETNKNDEKGNIASVYMNRYHKGMPLGADPTVKFALKDFGLRRILYTHLQVASPYNTYKNRGLPPGPICTPSNKTIDAVLNAPKTDYMFFVAKSDFSGYHTFTSNFADHIKYAHEYQKALDEYLLRKKTTSNP